MEKLPRNNIENYSHNDGLPRQGVRVVKQRDCICVKGVTLTGDAPKGFVRLYEFERDGKIRRNNPETWPLFIAKTGHKWYPIESITEHLLNRLGCVFGIVMADSGLAVINGQLRFLSRYFLRPEKETLVHGAEIFAGYLEDLAFVESVENANLSRSFFTLQFVEKAVTKAFPAEKDQIMHDLVKLWMYDAMVGNNDRHFFNWAVVQPFEKSKSAYFSPVYDTARGLFWNVSDNRLQMRVENKDMARYVQKYCDSSRPKLGWEGVDDINHFSLVKEIFDNQFYIKQDEVFYLFRKDILTQMRKTINDEFGRLLSNVRKTMINECLIYRYKRIKEIIR
ncbi:MAG: HipA domain-containing protein [Bacteroidales bacterium]|nr:HipA domain-containing protein [Bacteroidales bacterium]